MLLAEFETEAEALVVVAEREAQRRRDEAQQLAREISAGLRERMAATSAEIAAMDARASEAEEIAMRADAEKEMARLITSADTAIPGLVEAALNVIWDTLSNQKDRPR